MQQWGHERRLPSGIVTFPNAVTFNNAPRHLRRRTVASTSGSGTTAVTVNLTGVSNAQTITLTLSGVNDGATTGDVGVRMGVLLGDTTVNGNGAVSNPATFFGQDRCLRPSGQSSGVNAALAHRLQLS